VGFFVIERVILRSIPNFRSSSEVDVLWDTVTSKAVQIMYAALYGCIEPKLFNRVKKELTVFMQTLEVIYTKDEVHKEDESFVKSTLLILFYVWLVCQEYSYNVQKYVDLHLFVFQRYSELLKEKFADDFHQVCCLLVFVPRNLGYLKLLLL